MSSTADSHTSGHASKRWRAELRPWERFPLRLLLFYGGAALVLVAGVSWWGYRMAVQAEMDNLQQRLRMTSTSMALLVDGDKVFGLEGDEARAYWQGEVRADIERLARTVPHAADLYVFRVTDEPAKLQNLVDVLITDAWQGDEYHDFYDISDIPTMQAGLERPTVEEQLWVGSDADEDPSISGYHPLRDSSGRAVGLVGVDVRAPRLREIRREAMASAGLAFLIALGLLGGISLLVGRQIVRPLGRVIDASDAIAGGDLHVRIEPTRRDEFGLLGRYFDSMAEGLEEREFIRETFGRYVSASVADTILGERSVQLGGEVREVTVLFSDLRGYSTITERAEPQEVVRLLNEYLGEMTEVIDARGGVVIEFLGDGILAVFNAPLDLADHAARAVDAAVAMQERLVELHEAWEADGTAHLWQDVGLDRLVTRIGIHSGRVIAGNLGSRKRLKYAVIGDNVNIAARLEQTNKELGTTILLSAAVAERLPDDAYDLEARGAVPVKGREEPVELYSL